MSYNEGLAPSFIRSAEPRDLEQVMALAKGLDSYNLPYDRAYVTELLRVTQRSFAGHPPAPRAGKYLFVMEVPRRHELVGCSLIIAHHGTPGAPHVYLERVRARGRDTLQLRSTTRGVTEIGGLMVHPRYRRRPERYGRQLSYVRFTYMAMHPEWFQRRVIVEYLASSLKEEPRLWQALGRRLTGLSYHEAERLSARSNQFLLDLFPKGQIACDRLPAEAVATLGQVSPQAQPACRFLERIGFRRTNQLDPCDGGPCYAAVLRQITLVRRTRRCRVQLSAEDRLPALALVAVERHGRLLAAQTSCRIAGPSVGLSEQTRHLLKIHPGEQVTVMPMTGSRR